MKLLMIRHGQTPSNVMGALDTAAPGAPLDETGLLQAAGLVNRLENEEVGSLYASPLIRARMTAEPLATTRKLALNERDGLRELAAGELEMRNDKESLLAYYSVFMRWLTGDLAARLPGGESGSAALRRFTSVIEELEAQDPGAATVVSHGAMLMVWTRAMASNVSLDFIRTAPLSNAGVLALEGSMSKGWVVSSWDGTKLD
ncbi:histidine phosphatase family protein [Paeniglutamicibacter cryotolerans]|uniref:Putative phosphoglycerate mutase n=1 Tax=Paeniglutamicibacter cryotolerans TaxID=670079 RepID=A0A839QH55_9MICC|nr:histidine phosphatase family protein [Paeniglutamicibacter cryotolerans]MBB2995509.1 putative phosphoglycerate mutase [Paeniglutamicibacter cryotolerans]